MIYLCFLFRSGGFCPLCKSQFCPCPYKNPPALLPAEKCLPAAHLPKLQMPQSAPPGDSRKQRYNTLDFRGKVVCQGRRCPPLETSCQGERCSPLDTPACPCSGYPSCFRTPDTLLPEQVKQAQRFARVAGRLLCLFLFSGGWAKHTRKPCRTLGLGWRFSYGVRKLIVLSPYIWYNKTVEFSDRRYPYGHLLQ